MKPRKRVKHLAVLGLILFISGMVIWGHSIAVLFIPASWVPIELRYWGRVLLVVGSADVAVASFAAAWIGYVIWAWAYKRQTTV